MTVTIGSFSTTVQLGFTEFNGCTLRNVGRYLKHLLPGCVPYHAYNAVIARENAYGVLVPSKEVRDASVQFVDSDHPPYAVLLSPAEDTASSGPSSVHVKYPDITCVLYYHLDPEVRGVAAVGQCWQCRLWVMPHV